MKKFGDLYYSFVYEFVIIPFLVLTTYIMYGNLVYIDGVMENKIIFYLIVALLLAFNIGVVYLIAYIYNKVYKVDVKYYNIVGSVAIGLVLWIKVFWYVMERVTCYEISGNRCADAIIYNQISTFILVVTVFYFLVYVILHRMIAKKISLDKLALKNEKSKKNIKSK